VLGPWTADRGEVEARGARLGHKFQAT
jgi:hypothetical protein